MRSKNVVADAIVTGAAPRIESAAIAGIVSSVLGVAAGLLFRFYDPTLTDRELVQWYGDTDNHWRFTLGLNLAVFSAIAFLWFVAVIRRRLGEREDRFFATVFFGSAIAWIVVYIAGSISFAAVPLAHGFVDDWTPSADIIRLSSGYSAGWLLVAGPRIQAVFIFSTSTLFLRTKVVSDWLAYFGYTLGAVLFIIPLVWRPVAFGLPIWVLIASLTLLVVRHPDDLIGPRTAETP